MRFVNTRKAFRATELDVPSPVYVLDDTFYFTSSCESEDLTHLRGDRAEPAVAPRLMRFSNFLFSLSGNRLMLCFVSLDLLP